MSVNGLLFHDLRRSANRNMRDAGLPLRMRMKIMGHKTASMDRRYGIVDLTDIQIARELPEGGARELDSQAR
jgi:integrase